MPSKLVSLALTLFLLCVSITFEQCKAASKKQIDPSSLALIVKNKIGEPYNTDYSSDKRYVLCQQSRVNDHSARNFRFIVVRTLDNAIVKEGSFRMGYVKWNDNESIEVLTSTGPGENAEKKIISIAVRDN